MFPGLIDVVLHLIAVIMSYWFFGEYTAKAYVGFAVLNFIILWCIYGDYVDCFKKVPIWFWNLATNLILLLIIIPVSIDLVKARIAVLGDRLITAKYILSQPPKFDGLYMLEKVCETGCGEQSFVGKIDSIEQSIKVYEAYFETLWWGTLPFTWGFFLLSLAVSLYISINKKH